MDKLLEIILSNALGTIGVTIVGWLLSKYVEQINQRITDYNKNSLERSAELSARINGMELKYRDVLDIVLSKFSKWEDRILGLIERLGTVSPEEIQREIEEFRVEATNDIGLMRLRVEQVNSEVQKLIQDPMGHQSKQTILAKIDRISVELHSRIYEIEKMNAKLTTILSAVNQKQKEHEFKIGNLIATRPTVNVKPG